MAKRRAKKLAAAAHLAPATEAGATTAAAAASTSHDVEMPTTPDSSNSPAPQDSEASDEARVKKRKAGSTRRSTEPGLREILRLARDNFSAFEKPPTGRRRSTTRSETVPVQQQRPISRARAHSSSETSAAGRSPSPAPSTSSLSSLSSSDAESEQEEDSSASSGEDDDEAQSSECAERGCRSPSPATRDSVAPADLAATAEEVASPHDCPPSAAAPAATDQAAWSNTTFERSPGQAKSNKRRRAPKRPRSEVAMLQRDYFAASRDDLLADSKKKRTRRTEVLANSAPPTSSSVATGLEEAVLPCAEPDANVPIEPKPAAPVVKTKKRRAASRDSGAPPSELRWLKSDYFSAAQQPVQGKRRSHSRKEAETARTIESVRAAKRVHMAKRDAVKANSPPPPPPPKRRRTAVSPELVGPERADEPKASTDGGEEAQQRDISPELYAPSSAKPTPPAASHVPQSVITTESPPTISTDGDLLRPSPAIAASPAATESSSLPKKRQRKRPARYADASDALDTDGSASKPAVLASTSASLAGIRGNEVQSPSQASGRSLDDGQIPNKPTGAKRGRPPKAVAQVIHPTDPTAGTALPDNVIVDRSGLSMPSQDASPLAAVEVPAETTKPSKPKQLAPTSAIPRQKREKPRTRHAAFDSRESWVKPERDLKLRENGRPPIWCEGRQELCETLDYFKSYQGGHCAYGTRSPTEGPTEANDVSFRPQMISKNAALATCSTGSAPRTTSARRMARSSSRSTLTVTLWSPRFLR